MSGLKRKRTTIFYADVAGYSRLTGEDEVGTHSLLSDYLDIISATINDHQGRVVHSAGDAVLADFATVCWPATISRSKFDHCIVSNPWRCQATTVSGLTMTSASFQRGHRREIKTQNKRSGGRSRGRGLARFRITT